MMELLDYVKSQPIRTFSKNELLFSSDSPGDTFLAIREGFVTTTTTDDSGRQRILWIAGRYDIVPLERFFTKKTLQYDYVAYSDGSAYVINKDVIHKFINENPKFGLEVAHGISEHLDDAFERLSAVGSADIRRKLLHTLYTLATRFSSAEVVAMHEIGLNLTHQDLADLIGASREVVSLELQKIRRDKFIEYTRSELTVNVVKIKKSIRLKA